MAVMKDEAIKGHNETITYKKGAEFINIAPDKQGYASMAAMFGENVVGQVPREFRNNASALIGSVINIAGHLGNAMAAGDEEAKEAYDWLVARFPQE